MEDKNKKKNKIPSKQKQTSKKNVKRNTSKKQEQKVIKMNTDFTSQNFIHVKKVKNIFIIVVILLVLLIGRIGFLQFFYQKEGSSLKERAYRQQAINQIISPKRGNIYDATGKALAISAQVDTITINPGKIKDSDNDTLKTKDLKEKVAKGLSEIFELDYEETLQKVTSESQVETIAKKVEQDKIEKLKTWMKENKITVGINIDEDTKRYYPYDTVASQVIGFCGTDNQGITGIENSWDSTLNGTPR